MAQHGRLPAGSRGRGLPTSEAQSLKLRTSCFVGLSVMAMAAAGTEGVSQQTIRKALTPAADTSPGLKLGFDPVFTRGSSQGPMSSTAPENGASPAKYSSSRA